MTDQADRAFKQGMAAIARQNERQESDMRDEEQAKVQEQIADSEAARNAKVTTSGLSPAVAAAPDARSSIVTKGGEDPHESLHTFRASTAAEVSLAPLGVGEGARISRAEQAVLDLPSDPKKQALVIQAAIDGAIMDENLKRSQAREALDAKTQEEAKEFVNAGKPASKVSAVAPTPAGSSTPPGPVPGEPNVTASHEGPAAVPVTKKEGETAATGQTDAPSTFKTEKVTDVGVTDASAVIAKVKTLAELDAIEKAEEAGSNRKGVCEAITRRRTELAGE